MLNCLRMLHRDSNLLKSYATVDQYFDSLIHYPPTVQFNKAHFCIEHGRLLHLVLVD